MSHGDHTIERWKKQRATLKSASRAVRNGTGTGDPRERERLKKLIEKLEAMIRDVEEERAEEERETVKKQQNKPTEQLDDPENSDDEGEEGEEGGGEDDPYAGIAEEFMDSDHVRLPSGITLDEWDMNDVTDDATVIYFGKRRKGKTFAARELLYTKSRRFPSGLVMTKTKANKFWEQYVPKKYVLGNYSPSVLHQLMGRANFILDHPEEERDPSIFIVLDDIVADRRLRYDPTLEELVSSKEG